MTPRSRIRPSAPQPGVRFGASSLAYRDSAYAGASRTRKQLANWQPEKWPADAELLPAQDLLIARSRDLDRNNGIANGAFQSLNDNVVGMGLRLAAAPDHIALGKDLKWREAWSRNVESLWHSWANTTACDVTGRMTFAALTQLVFRSTLQNGEALALPLWVDRPGTTFRTCIQLVDSDRLSNPEFTPSTPNLRAGVELDDFGRPVAYHVKKGAAWTGLEAWFLTIAAGGLAGTGVFRQMDWERIPAETEWGRKQVIHVFSQDRVDQSRGKPILTPVIEQFRMLDAYQRTELQSSIVNALVCGVIETPLDPAAISELMGGDAATYLETKGEYRIQAEGGTFFPLYPGDKLTPYVPNRPANTFLPFCESLLRQIGVCLGMPYELVLKDFSKTNYSSARAALLEAWRFFYTRRHWLSTYWAAPVYKLWLEEAVSAGLVDAPDFYEMAPFYLRAKWIGPGRGWIDPVKEAQASQMRMDSMISTLELECAEQGLDWNEVLEQRALELERMKELNLTPPAKAGTPPGQMPQEPDPAQEPADDEEEEAPEEEEETVDPETVEEAA